MPDRSDKFDEVRRAWIAAHQGWSTIQRRRAEQLGRKVRARQRATAAAVPDPHDDTVIPPLWLRTAQSPASQVEAVLVAAALIIAPLGWLGGYLLKCVVTHLIPRTLRAYPIAGFLWAGAVLGLLIAVLYDPAPNLRSDRRHAVAVCAGRRGSGGRRSVRHRRGLAGGDRIRSMVAADPAEATASPLRTPRKSWDPTTRPAPD